jgi:signal peptidase I
LKKNAKNIKLYIVASVLVMLIIAIIIIRNYVFEIAITSGASMEPTITQGDHVLINRLAYRSQAPERGEIITIKIGWVMMIKRVLGLPGDVIELKNGILYCNSKLIEREKRPIPSANKSKQRSFKPMMVWDKHFFIIGDNEEHSIDSRDFGIIPYKDIVGKVILIYYPYGRIRKFD